LGLIASQNRSHFALLTVQMYGGPVSPGKRYTVAASKKKIVLSTNLFHQHPIKLSLMFCYNTTTPANNNLKLINMDDPSQVGRVVTVPNSGAGGSRRKTSRFSCDTPEYQYLEQLMKTPGMISPTDRPSDVKERFSQFAGLTASQFRSQFNRLKNMHGTNARDGKKRVLLPT